MLHVYFRLYLAIFTQNNAVVSRNKAVENAAIVHMEKIGMLRRQLVFIKPSPTVVMTTTGKSTRKLIVLSLEKVMN